MDVHNILYEIQHIVSQLTAVEHCTVGHMYQLDLAKLPSNSLKATADIAEFIRSHVQYSIEVSKFTEWHSAIGDFA